MSTMKYMVVTRVLSILLASIPCSPQESASWICAAAEVQENLNLKDERAAMPRLQVPELLHGWMNTVTMNVKHVIHSRRMMKSRIRVLHGVIVIEARRR